MTHLPIVDRIDKTIIAATSHIQQRTTGRFGTVDAIAAAASPPDTECSFELETAELHSALIDISAEASSEIDRLARDLRNDETEAQIFLAEHRLVREPPCATIATLALFIVIAMGLESLGTAPAYSASLGWPAAFAVAGLICLGVTGPALAIGLGVVAARHNSSNGYRFLGGVAILAGLACMAFALLCGAHFRELVTSNPKLILHPIDTIEAIIGSLQTSWSAPLFDPPNWGLLGVGAMAGALTAWKTFNTWGYVGWRSIGLNKQERREAILEAADAAQKEGAAAKRKEEGKVTAKVKRFQRNRRELTRSRALSDAIVTSGNTAYAIGSKMRGDAVAIAVQAVRDVNSPAAGQLDVAACPLRSQPAFDRTGFNAEVAAAIDRQDGAIAKQPAAVATLSEMYRAFTASLKHATARALNREPAWQSSEPVLSSPEGWR